MIQQREQRPSKLRIFWMQSGRSWVSKQKNKSCILSTMYLYYIKVNDVYFVLMLLQLLLPMEPAPVMLVCQCKYYITTKLRSNSVILGECTQLYFTAS